MALKTASVPPPLVSAFETAERLVESYFRELTFLPESGQVRILGERYVMIRAAALSVEFFELVRDLFGPDRVGEADAFARNILFDLAHSVGKTDARQFHEQFHLRDPVARLAAGPIHFAHTGWAYVRIQPSSQVSTDDYFLLYDHPYSFEADAWLESGRSARFPVCIMGAGYSSGWCEESFGQPLVSSEVLCRARGDSCCRFVMAAPERIEAAVAKHVVGSSQTGGYTIPDFFARKKMEEELRRARSALEERVDERTRELSEANLHLRREIAARKGIERQLIQTQKLEAIGRLAAGVAHDFNNLMGVVIGHARMLERRLEAGDETALLHVREIRDAGQQAAELTRQLLAFGSAQPGAPELLELNETVEQVVKTLSRLVGADVSIELDLRAERPVVRLERGQLTQILLNLVVNARDAITSGGVITIRTTEPVSSHEVLLEVADTGSGMDDETASRALEPFFTTKPAGEGTGLGLSTVYGIVSGAGGRVVVQSTRGEGTSFQIHLPRTSGATGPGSPAAERPPVRGGDERILFVEDQASLQALLASALESYGYEVHRASSPEEALERAEGTSFDLLVSDVILPRMSGHQLAERLRASHPTLRVLFVSGYADDAKVRAGVREGRAEFLAKPFTPEVLAERVRRVLDEPQQVE